MLFCVYISPFVSACQLLPIAGTASRPCAAQLRPRESAGRSLRAGGLRPFDERRKRPTLTEFPAARSVSGCVPVRAEADLHLEGHGEIRSMPHPVRDDRGEFVEFALGDLEDEFVVHLQQ